MAYVSTDNAGRQRIFYFDAQGERQTLRVGRLAIKDAEKIVKHVGHIVNAKIKGEPEPRDTAEWLAGVDAKLRAKMVRLGLTTARKTEAAPKPIEPAAVTVGDFVNSYIELKAGVEDATKEIWHRARKNLVDFSWLG